MVNTCLDEQLLAHAVANTGVNVSLLVKALSGLCIQKSPVHAVANSPGFIGIVYVCCFIPWVLPCFIDFVSSSWSSVREARRSGWCHFFLAVVASLTAIAYARIQAQEGDFKEVFKAVVVLMVLCYQIRRTVLILVQLGEYQKWCKRALSSIRAFRKALDGGGSDDEDDSGTELETALMVNREIVGAKLDDNDVHNFNSTSNGRNDLINPNLCSVRWTSAFLCCFGHKWGEMFKYRSITCFESITIIPLSTIPWNGRRSEKSLLSALQLFSCTEEPFNASGYKIVDPTLLKYEDEISNIVQSCNRVNELVQQNRDATSIDQVELVFSAMNLWSVNGTSDNDELQTNGFHCYDEERLAWLVLHQQLGSLESARELSDIPPFWRFFATAPLWQKNKNQNVLQASIHVDISVALAWGEQFETSEKQLVFEIPSHEVFHFFRHRLAQHDQLPPERFLLGIVLDVVRSFLAEWALANFSKGEDISWSPLIPNQNFVFTASDYLCDHCSYVEVSAFLKGRIIWECQYALQACIEQHKFNDDNLPGRVELIMLFLSAYPQIQVYRTIVEIDGSDPVVQFEIVPINVPQALYIEVLVDTVSGNASIELKSEKRSIQFMWEKWINAAMGLMKGHGELWESFWDDEEDVYQGPIALINPADLSRPMLKLEPPETEDHEEEDIPGELWVWTAWPIFDSRVCQFEVDQWMASCGALREAEAGQFYHRRLEAVKVLKATTELLGDEGFYDAYRIRNEKYVVKSMIWKRCRN